MNSEHISIRKEHENKMIERRNEMKMEEHRLADLKNLLNAKIRALESDTEGVRAT